MHTRLLLFIFFAFITTGCVRHHVVMPEALMQTTQNRSVPPFNHVVVQGPLNVNLVTGSSKSYLVLHGTPQDLLQVSSVVVDRTLIVKFQAVKSKQGPITADIHTASLNSLVYKGAGDVIGKNINSQSFELDVTNPGRTMLSGNIHLHTLSAHGPGYTEVRGVNTQNLQLSISKMSKVQLVGVANISRLSLDGDGWFGMYWVKSNLLTIRAKGHAFIKLAGIANTLDVELWNFAHFNGRHLRANVTFAKTHDHSLAEITALDKQHVLATDASDVWYYKIPEMKADFMGFNGAVLNMKGWNPEAIEKDYTRYNK